MSLSGCTRVNPRVPPPHHVCTVKFQERFPLRTLGADFIYINKNQKYGGGVRVWLLLRVCRRLVGLERVAQVGAPGIRGEAQPSLV